SRLLLHTHQLGVLWLLKVIVGATGSIHRHRPTGAKGTDDRFTDHERIGTKGEMTRFQRTKGLGVIAQYHDMTVFLMLEVVVDAFFSQQTLDKVQLRLIVLDAIGPTRILALEFKPIK